MARIRREGKMTIEEHLAFGEAIAKMRHRLWHAEECFKVNSRGARKIRKVARALEDMRCEMVSVICDDYSDYDTGHRAYYSSEERLTGSDRDFLNTFLPPNHVEVDPNKDAERWLNATDRPKSGDA